jgi:two-component system LytT family sensor kinase
MKTLALKKQHLIHLIFWLVLFVLLYLMHLERANDDVGRAVTQTLLKEVIFLVFFYLNYFVLIPQYYFSKKYLFYGRLVVSAAIICFYFLDQVREAFPPPWKATRPEPPPGGFRGDGPPSPMPNILFRNMPNTFLLIFTGLLSILLKVTESSRRNEEQMVMLRAEKSDAELKFLKSQINPHFLFNALNNIYSLAVTKSEKAPEMILNLSTLLRYIIYDSNTDAVPVLHEVKYIEDYIELQKLKDENVRQVEFDFKGDDNVKISPMILIPFVENAFKHSKIEDVDQGWIKIELSTSQEKGIRFVVANSLPPQGYAKDETGGIGIVNVKKRLQMVYGSRHNLTIEEKNDAFAVKLEIRFA